MRSSEIAAELLRRQAEGTWPEQPEMIGSAGEIALDSIGFRAPLGAFYEDTHLMRPAMR